MPKIRYEDTATHRALTRRDIIDAAVPLFLSGGLAATSLDQVARAVGIGRTTLYNYFPHKEDILLAYIDQAFGRVSEVELHPDLQHPDPPVAMRRLVELTLERRASPEHAEAARLYRMLLEEAGPAARRSVLAAADRFMATVRGLLADILRRGLRAGVFGGAPAEYQAAVLVAMIDAAAREAEERRMTAGEAVDLVMHCFRRMTAPGA